MFSQKRREIGGWPAPVFGMSVCGRALCFPGSGPGGGARRQGLSRRACSSDPHKSLALGSQCRAAVPSRAYRAASTGKSGFCEEAASRETPPGPGPPSLRGTHRLPLNHPSRFKPLKQGLPSLLPVCVWATD